mgnify:FL=1
MRHKADLLFFIYASNEPKSVLARDLGDCRDNLRNTLRGFLIVVLTATVITTCAGCLGRQQKYIGYSVLGGFSKVSQKSFSRVLFHPDLQQKPMIALTFDDGPKAGVTDWLLDELEKRNVKVTFFLIGSQADLPENREIIRRMAEDGHQIGCHTYHHVQMTTLSENQQKQEILQWYQVVSGIIGDFSYAVRPPYGCVNNAVCRSLNVPVILWSVDTEDWTGKSAGEIADYVISEAKDGDIILLHDIFEESVQGAVMALDDLMRRGYTFVTVNDLLADRGIAIQSGKVYRQAAQGGK